MNILRLVMLSAAFTITVFSVAVYSSCNKNKCDKVVCLNLGACDAGNCVCPVGFEGLRCESLSRDKFIFTYNGGDSCTGPKFNKYAIYMHAVLTDSVTMTMLNLLGNIQDSATCTMQATDSFSFIGSNNSTTFTGTGKLKNDSLWLVYHVTHDTTSYNCKYFGQSLRR